MEKMIKQQFSRKKSKKKKRIDSNRYSNEQKQLLPEIITFKNLYLSTKKTTLLQDTIDKLYHRLYPLSQISSHKLKEQWQNKKFQFQENIYNQLVQFQTIMALIYTIIILVSYLGILWFVSTFRLLQTFKEKQAASLIFFGILTVIADGGVKFYFKLYFQKQDLSKLQICSYFKVQIYFICYFIVNLILVMYKRNQELYQICYIFDFIASLLCYHRANLLWHYLKIITCTTKFKIKFKFVDLFGTLLLLAHIFALLLYVASFTNADKNWANKLGQSQLTNFDRYFYAVYFSFTTMLTIGYGDIVPINKFEILVILVVQVVGVATFAYIINEIGFTIGLLRKQEEHLQHNLSTLLKMSKFYRLKQDLVTVAKTHLISNRKSINMIYPQDENKVLSQLNDDLRQTIIFENGLSIVKNCSFFICHWTKYFQIEISKRLIKKILHPFEIVNQQPRKQKIYIVKSGKLQIYTNRNIDFKNNYKKLLKTICPNSKNQVSDNIYGYTSVMSRRPVKLNAISKDFTCVFTLSKQHFISCASENKQDHQYYYEIRDRIEQNRCVQAWQTPAVLDVRQHYHPSEFLLIKKHQNNTDQKRNYRKFKSRAKRLNSRLYYDNIEDSNHGHNQVRKKTFMLVSTMSDRHLPSLNLLVSKESTEQVQNMTFRFEGLKEYQKYFKKGNVSNILKNLQIRNYEIKRDDKGLTFSPSSYLIQYGGKFT